MSEDRPTEPAYLSTPLTRRHNRAAFACGTLAFDRYLREQAGQEMRGGYANVFVLEDATDPTVIVGYYTVSSHSILLSALPDGVSKRLPRYDSVPVALLGRLAVDQRWQGRRLGELLVYDAVDRIVDGRTVLAAWAVVVDAFTTDLVPWYERLGFEPVLGGGTRLFLPLKKAMELRSRP